MDNTNREGGISEAEVLFARPQFESTLKKIKQYVSVKTQEETTSDEEVVPSEGFVTETAGKTEMGVVHGEIKIPDADEVKNDFAVLARAMAVMEQGGGVVESTVWAPVRKVIESFVASYAAPRAVEERYDVLKPVLDLFENKESLIEEGAMADGVTDWIEGVDPDLADYMRAEKEAQKNAA